MRCSRQRSARERAALTLYSVREAETTGASSELAQAQPKGGAIPPGPRPAARRATPPPPRSILEAGGRGGGPGVSVGSQEQEAWSGDWRPDWEPEAALCSFLAGLLFPRGGGAPRTCLSLPPGLTRFLLSSFLHPSAPPFTSAFSKTSLNIRKFTVHILLKPGLENFEHYFTSM